jgi:hypothetical protein
VAEESLDLREHVPDDVVYEVERALRIRLELRTAAFGNDGGTVGYATSEGAWVRIQWRLQWRLNEQAWTGAEAASVMRGVALPRLLRSVRRTDSSAMWCGVRRN